MAKVARVGSEMKYDVNKMPGLKCSCQNVDT